MKELEFTEKLPKRINHRVLKARVATRLGIAAEKIGVVVYGEEGALQKVILHVDTEDDLKLDDIAAEVSVEPTDADFKAERESEDADEIERLVPLYERLLDHPRIQAKLRGGRL